MLQKPSIPDDVILSFLHADYGLRGKELVFLPLGADVNTAVYRVDAEDGTSYFLKLRGGDFHEAIVSIPKYLGDRGLERVIPPLQTRSGSLSGSLPPFHVILYPFVEGRHGYEKKLSPGQWAAFGAALRQIHATDLPASIGSSIPREDFSPRWRDAVSIYLDRLHNESFEDPIAVELAAFLKSKDAETRGLIDRAEGLAHQLLVHRPRYILCHGDIHGWNLLIDQSEAVYIVDWDTLIFAPKERDLMFIGAGLGDSGYTPEEEDAMFYEGYGPAEVDRTALAYYRFERIIEDIAAFCDQILSSDDDGEDRRQGLIYLKSNYLPGNTIDRAYAADVGAGPG